MGTGKYDGPLTDKDAIRICSAAGIATITERLATFKEIRNSINIAIAEADKAAEDAVKADRYLFAAKMVKAACDGFVGVAGELTGGWGKVVKEAYKGSSSIAGTLTDSYLDGSLNAGKVAKTTATTAFSTLSGLKEVAKIGKWSNAELLSELNTAAKALKVPTQTIISGVSQSDKNLIRTMFVDLAGDIGALSADAAKSMSDSEIGKKAAERTGRFFSAGKEMANAGIAMYDALDAFRKNDSSEGVRSAEQSLKKQLAVVEKKLLDLQYLLDQCAKEPIHQLFV